jgi:hypothetical protein
MPRPKRLNEPYTPADLKVMRDCARQKMSARQAAALLGRTRGAVAYKAMVEGIHFRAVSQPVGVQRRPAQRRKLSQLRKARAA